MQLDQTHQALLDDLQAANAQQIDPRYIAQQVDTHNQALYAMRMYMKSGDNPEEFLAWQSCLRPAFEELSEDQRKTLMLHFYEGYTIREISDRLGQPFGNVQHHLYRGIDRLRRHVFQRNGGAGK